MTFQRFLLRAILACLALAAGLGAGGVLVANNEMTWKIVGTLVLTAVASGLLLVVTHFLAAPAAHAAVTLATSLAAVEFLLGLGLIWDVYPHRNDDPERVGALIAALLATGVPAVCFLRGWWQTGLALACRGGLVLCGVTLTLWIIAIVSNPANGFDNDNSYHWFAYGWLVAAMGLPSLCAAVGAGQDRWHWRWVGIGSAAIAYVVLVRLVHQDRWTPQPATALMAVAVIVAHANLSLRCQVRTNQRWLIYATIALAAAAGLLVNLEVMNPATQYAQPDWSTLQRLLAAAGILYACGTIALVVLTRLGLKNAPLSRRGSGPLDVTIICPICGKKQTLIQGSGECRCGAKFQMVIQGPSLPSF